MIKGIELFKSLKTIAVKKLHNYTNPIRFNFPKLNQLEHDVFEYRADKPETLFFIPEIIEKKFNSGIINKRLLHLDTECRAYGVVESKNTFPNEYICIDPNGNRRLKPHIYINYVEVKPEYARKGVYSKTIKQLAKIAKGTDNCEGRIILDARNMNNYSSTQIPSPALAHWKCGFRFADESNNKIMERVLNGELPLEKAPEGIMYLPL